LATTRARRHGRVRPSVSHGLLVPSPGMMTTGFMRAHTVRGRQSVRARPPGSDRGAG
jgi:hypothetical protein